MGLLMIKGVSEIDYRSTCSFVQDDIKELEQLKEKITQGTKNTVAVIRYKQQYLLFLTTLKIAVNEGMITEYDALALKEEYAWCGGKKENG